MLNKKKNVRKTPKNGKCEERYPSYSDILIPHYVFDSVSGYEPSSPLETCRSEMFPEVKWNPVEAKMRVYVIPFSSLMCHL